jgi:hypothetical protein
MSTTLTAEELTEAFGYLDELRQSGRCNMFGASSYLRAEKLWDVRKAREATLLWMETFSNDLTLEERVDKALNK